MRSRFLYPVMAVALLAGCVPLEERTAHFENKWQAATITHLDLTEVNGTVTVTGDSPSAITMSATVRARGMRPEPKRQYDGYFTALLDGDTLTIQTRGSHHGFIFGWGKDEAMMAAPRLDRQRVAVE